MRRPRFIIQLALFITIALVASGCAIQHPHGYDALSELQPERVVASGAMDIDSIPDAYDTPDGRRVFVDMDDLSGAGVTFALRLEDHVLTCTSDPIGIGVPETRFGC